MEDYKKKYEEALGRAKVINPGTADYNIVTEIFPELKESEDERIKEDIISCVNEFWERIGSINPEYSSRSKMIAWLEKQGEQKPAWSEEDENMLQKAISTIMYALSIPFDKEDDPCFAGSSMISWLKSLKERYTWEPDDYQLEALDSATENCAYSEYQDCLRKLIVELKKLK